MNKNTAAGIVLGALAFGLIAGTTMVGMNVAAARLGIVKQEVVQATAAPETEAAETEAAQETQAVAPSVNAASTAAGSTISGIAKEAMPSVVAITNMMRYEQNGFSIWSGQPTQQEYEVPASGSGIIIGKTDSELLIVTNNHVVQDSTSLSVTFVDDKAVNASIKGTDSNVDLAVIAVKLQDIPTATLDKIKVATLGDSDKLEVGDQVVAIGNALGYGQSVTSGIISAKDRAIDTEEGETGGLLQTDAAINPGNSGGALLNMNGEVIGINVAKYADTKVEGMGYAIPSDKAKSVIANLSTLRTREAVPEAERGYLGIQVKNIDAQTSANFGMPQGVFVYKLTEGGAAASSGLQEKDVITALDGQGLKTYAQLQELLSYYRAGETVKLTVQRQNGSKYEEQTISVTLGAAPQGSESAQKSQNGQNSQNSQGSDKSQDGQQEGQDKNALPNPSGQDNGRGNQNNELWKQFEEFFNQYNSRR